MLEIEKADIHKHLDILQGIIGRMASNSASCKNYCITMVGALLALEQVKKESNLIFLALLPIISFAFLDMYYLYLETFSRGRYNHFVKIWQETDDIKDFPKNEIFNVGKPETGYKVILESFYQAKSISIFLFYGFLLLVVGALLFYTNCIFFESEMVPHHC